MQALSPLITYSTSKSVTEIMDQIEAALKNKGVTVFARISHSQAATHAGLSMQEEELIIFGNPKVGTALMLEQPAIGIELPLKILAWKDSQATLLAYQNLEQLAKDYQIKKAGDTITQLKGFMETLVKSVIG